MKARAKKMQTIETQIGATIVATRKARGLTQVDLAILTKKSPTTISLAERGLVSEETLSKIATALGVGLEELRS